MQQTRTFGIGEAIGAGWQRLWPNIGPMLLFAVAVWAVQLVLQMPNPETTLGSFLLSIVSFVVTQLIAIGWIKLALDITDGRPVSKDAITERFSLVVPYLIAAVLYSVMVGVGLVLLIVPGIILAIIFGFYGFHIVDTGETDAIGALKRSAEITQGNRMKLFLFALLLIGINILGLIALVVGVIITSAISLLAFAHVYRQLSPAVDTDTLPGAPPGPAPDGAW